MTHTTEYLTLALINLGTITIPLLIVLLKMERRLTRLEIEHHIYHKNKTQCQP